jgi:hypothetical protein
MSPYGTRIVTPFLFHKLGAGDDDTLFWRSGAILLLNKNIPFYLLIHVTITPSHIKESSKCIHGKPIKAFISISLSASISAVTVIL